MRSFFLPLFVALLAFLSSSAQRGGNEPEPVYVAPGAHQGAPPADAVILFGGADLSNWCNRDGGPAGCTVEDQVIVCRTGDGNLYSKETFGDAQVHLEYRIPSMPDEKGQRRGNSGVYLQGRYEVQVLDGYENPTYAMGFVGAIYGVAPPLVNASRKPEEWQSYDIVFRAPQCQEDQLIHPGTVTVFLNGVLVQDHVSLRHRRGDCIKRDIGEPGPLMLQDHSGFPNAPRTEMRFRNIWLRHLDN